jgi:membrane-associated phospholipid phosphatase
MVGYVVVTAMMVGIGALLTNVLDSSVGRWDFEVAQFFDRHRSRAANAITKRATSGVGSLLRVHHASLPALIVAGNVVEVLVRRGRGREGAFRAIALALEFSSYRSVVHFVSRQRPHVFDLDKSPSNTSFPSGHTAAATVLFIGLIVIVFLTTRSVAARVLAAIVAIVVIAMVGFARVYRAQHSLTDVLAGVVLGLACLVVAAVAVRVASGAA